MTEAGPSRLRRFVGDFAALLSDDPSEGAILAGGADLLRGLVAQDDWLPDAFAAPGRPYAQHLLHCDSRARFSVVSFVWSPGQGTPVHDHTVWGLVGVLRGAEIARPHMSGAGGRLQPLDPIRLERGEVASVSPSVGDIHRVSNALPDRTSISIQVYGANIGAVERSVFLPDGSRRRFVSGYSNTVVPNIWGPPDATPNVGEAWA
jgi:predicted metal-dependent enzyme (double-stranded beta helix superfamily)